jgi:hypothetical protein
VRNEYTPFEIPPTVAELNKLVVELNSAAFDLRHCSGALTKYHPDKINHYLVKLEEMKDKVRKLIAFTNTLNVGMLDCMIEIDDHRAELSGNIDPTRKREAITNERREPVRQEPKVGPPARVNDRAPRPTKSREDTTRKSFSLANAVASNRTRP